MFSMADGTMKVMMPPTNMKIHPKGLERNSQNGHFTSSL